MENRKVVLVSTRVVKKGKEGPGAVYIGRPSQWGNPFVIGRDGTREEVIEQYKQWLWTTMLHDETTEQALLALDGKELVCFCAPLPCHGDVLIAAIEWIKNRRSQ